jgi:prepilin signal peptidase PulO-like enzyme (type II secretory pathway)
MSVLDRACPSCGHATIAVWKLVFWRVRCRHCDALVGTSPAWRLPILSVEMVVWLLAMNWLYRDYGRAGLVASFAVWFFVDLVADWYTPLVARRR